MIKINLIPVETRAEEAKKDWIIIGISAITLVVLILFGYYLLGIYQEKRVSLKLASANKKLEKYEQIAKEVENLEKSRVMLKKRKDVIQGLIKDRLLYSPFMYDFVSILPDKVWISNIKTTTNDDNTLTIDVSGSSFSNFSIADWITNLETSGQFYEVTLGRISAREAKEQQKILSFTLKFNYKKAS